MVKSNDQESIRQANEFLFGAGKVTQMKIKTHKTVLPG